MADYSLPFGVDIDLIFGNMSNPADYLQRKASSMRGHSLNGEALENIIDECGDPLHYEVFEANVPAEKGHLKCGISKLQPGSVGGECFMTKGHFHEDPRTAEIYICIRGMGYLLMKTPEGDRCVAELMARNRMVYVPPFWAHRSINTGDEPLISFFAYPAAAGHNYGDIEVEGFPRRIFRREGRVVIEEVPT